MIFLSNHYSNPFVTGGQYLLTKNPDFSHFWKINPSPPPSDLFLEILELPPGCDRRHGFLSETGNALFTLTQMWNRKWPLCVCIPIWNSSLALYTIKLQDGRNQRGMAMTLFALYSLLISSDRGIYSISEDDFFSSRCREHSCYCGCLPDMLTGQWNIYRSQLLLRVSFCSCSVSDIHIFNHNRSYKDYSYNKLLYKNYLSWAKFWNDLHPMYLIISFIAKGAWMKAFGKQGHNLEKFRN